MDLTSIRTPQAIATWLACDPPRHAQNHALDDLGRELGQDQALAVWAQGQRLHRETVA